MKGLLIGGGIWLLLLLAACSLTPAASEITAQILRTPQSVPTQATLATVPVSLSPTPTTHTTTTTIDPSTTAVPTATHIATTTPSPYTVIGTSTGGHPIVSYQFGNGPIPIILVGGIHGGYEWNTILLAYEMIDFFDERPEQMPENISLIIIPSANPDGQFLITGSDGRFSPTDIPPDIDTLPGRFNANNVDLNRNWDCEWSETAVWRDQPVNSGSQPFSEPENRVLRDYFLQKKPALVIFWHSAGNGVFAAGCPEIYTPSLQLATIFGQAADYPVYEKFLYYPITGDAGDWLATQDIPSISIELKTHEATDWLANQAGMLTILAYYGNPDRNYPLTIVPVE
ncbi:MAG: hypothetical protein GY796_26930 [Chloroflexi bacterium]|nr:hypothetical protein [Chloroflexota bacterium]